MKENTRKAIVDASQCSKIIELCYTAVEIFYYGSVTDHTDSLDYNWASKYPKVYREFGNRKFGTSPN